MNAQYRQLLRSGDLSWYTCLLCAGLLPLHIHWIPPFMVALAVLRLLERKEESFMELPGNRRNKYLLFLFLLLFLWQFSGLIFADSLHAGLERMFKRTAMVLFPAALYYPSGNIKLRLKLILKIFVVCLLLYLIYCFAIAFGNSISRIDGKLVFRPYHELYTWESWFTGMRLSGRVHPAYLTMYVMLAILITLDLYFDYKTSKKERRAWLIISILFFPVIFMLSVRSAVIASAVIFPLYFILKLRARYPGWLLYSVVSAFVIMFAVLLVINTRMRYTFEDISKEKINETMVKDIRLNIWRSAFGVISENMVLGVGTGNASSELKKEFVRRGHTEGLYDDLNAHNQFLEILLENGIVGLIIFLSIFGYITWLAISDQNHLLLCFIIMSLIFFAFESMLNRLAGIMFFPLFTFLLLHYRITEPD